MAGEQTLSCWSVAPRKIFWSDYLQETCDNKKHQETQRNISNRFEPPSPQIRKNLTCNETAKAVLRAIWVTQSLPWDKWTIPVRRPNQGEDDPCMPIESNPECDQGICK
ncbi:MULTISPECIES: hypothetical protein [Rhodobacterales]|uniref:hypothetical protein n=1 Tax=Rhodobacterales TaxID=204455 RepID=UPI0015F09990|nr:MULTISPECIES: hypothetical protein [Rhodobacterales]MDO6589705.1 hypothetical protein [Yoonia sp. 1_MG-2023]